RPLPSACVTSISSSGSMSPPSVAGGAWRADSEGSPFTRSGSRLGSIVGSCAGASAGRRNGLHLDTTNRLSYFRTVFLLSAVRRLLDVVRRWEIFNQLVPGLEPWNVVVVRDHLQ